MTVPNISLSSLVEKVTAGFYGSHTRMQSSSSMKGTNRKCEGTVGSETTKKGKFVH